MILKINIMIFILNLCVNLTIASADTNSNTRETIFSKVLSNGSNVVLERNRSVELRNDRNSPSPADMPPNAKVIYGNYIHDNYTLTIESGTSRENIWEYKVTHVDSFMLSEGTGVVSSNIEQEASHWAKLTKSRLVGLFDVEVIGDKTYIMFASKGHIRLQVLKKNNNGKWNTETSEAIADGNSGEIIRHGEKVEIQFKRANGTHEKLEWAELNP